MKTKNLTALFVIAIFLVSGMLNQCYTQESKQLFQKGLMKENGEGNLVDAIRIYEAIVADENAETSVKAKAQLHIGLCYEKLGKEEAIKAYELVVQNYKNYKEEYDVATSRLQVLIIEENEDDFNMINLYDKGASIRNGTMLEHTSISPDGSKLLGIDFSVGQNVAVQDLKTKKISLITNYTWTENNDGWTYFPVWSPDGKEIVYMYCDWVAGIMELQIAGPDGKIRTLLSKKTNAQIIPRQWTNDGKHIMTYIQDTTGIYTIAMVSVSDAKVTPLYKTQWSGKFITGNASISPDSRFIVLSDGPGDNLNLYIISVDGGPATQITNFPMNEHEPLWSPDGEYIAFIKETKGESFLYRTKIVDGKIVGQPIMVRQGMQNVSLNNWNEQGICCTMMLVLHDIYTLAMDPEMGIPTGVPVPVDYAPTGSNLTPAWSHDGNYLAFFSDDHGSEIVIMPMDGGENRHYPIDVDGFWVMTAHCLQWQPDNTGLGFNILDSENNPILYRLDVATGELESWRLPTDGHARIIMGPENNTVIYTDNDNENGAGIFQFNLETNETKQLIKIEEEEEWFVIRQLSNSHDFKNVAFLLNNTKLMIYNTETGEGGIFKENYAAPAFSPDGTKILALNKEGLTVFTNGGEVLHQYDIRKTFEPGTMMWGFDWSPDGEKLVFNIRKGMVENYLMKNVLK